MHEEILAEEQKRLLPLVENFYKDFGLVGGTAIALQIGHRQSIDFDLFSLREFDNAKIRRAIVRKGWQIGRVFKDEAGQFTFFVNSVQFTFFYYPFPITFSKDWEKTVRMPDLLTLAAMKAYALGRRAKWKDYVDLYFIIDRYHSIGKVVDKTKEIFGNEFNERIFREQISYFDDIDYAETVNFLPGFEVSDEVVKQKLIEFSLA